jgi:hypothetical protein
VTRAREIASQGGLVLLNTTNFSAASNVSIDNLFSATYDNYTLVINVLTSANEQIRMRYRASGANDTTSNYRYHVQFPSSSSTAYVGNASATETSNLIASSEGTVSSHAINLNVFSPFLSENTKSLGLHNGSGPSGGGPIVGGVTHGQFITTTSFTGFSFYVGTGTMTGTVRIYGMRN